MSMNIVVIGSGYVGTTTSALLAATGNTVVALDIDDKKVAQINSGKAPFFEEGLDLLIAHGIQSNSLTATTDTSVIKNADIIFSCVGTPDNPDGSPNLRYVDQVAETVASLAKENAIFVQKSTVPVGTGERLQKVLSKQIYVSNPEFLREGSALSDSIFYDRLVLGTNTVTAAKTVEALFIAIHNQAEQLYTIFKKDIKHPTPEAGKTLITSINSAELIKVTANAFLALKISFANSIAHLADKTNADVVEVMDGIGLDARIGRSFLNAGRGYGGGCFPKDVSGLISVAVAHGVNMPIMTAATEVNQAMPGYILSKLDAVTPLRGKKVAVLGLAFKAGTSDSRKSPAVEIANTLIHEGATVTAYDPQANEEAKHDLSTGVTITASTEEAVHNADITIIATNWPEFCDLTPDFYAKTMSGKIIVDAMNCLDKQSIQEAGLTYIGVGR